MPDQQARFVLEQERAFVAPPERVFAMLTEADELATWWGPRGFATPEVMLDPRVGGRYRFTMQPPDGETFHLSGEYLEIHPSDRLRFTFRWDEPVPDDRGTVVLLSLGSRGGTSLVSLWQGDFATEERLNLHAQGWAESFEKLEAQLRRA